MKKLFLSIAGLFAAIPGVIILQSGIGVPPGYKLLFGGTIETFGAFSLLLLWINRENIRRCSVSRITKWAIRLGSLCAISIAAYTIMFGLSVVEHRRGTAYFPIWTEGKVAEMINRSGSRKSAIENYGIDAVKEAIDEMPPAPLLMTTIFLLFLNQAIFSTVSLMFGLLGFYEVKQI